MTHHLSNRRGATALAILITLSAPLASCGDEPSEGLYTKAQGEQLAREVIEAWGKGQTTAVRERCMIPFRFGTRMWTTAKDLANNLKFQVDRRRTDVVGFDSYSVYSRQDLEDGRWPRGRTVSEGRRADEIAKLSVGVEGFLIRASREKTRGWQLIVNPDDKGLLKVQGIIL